MKNPDQLLTHRFASLLSALLLITGLAYATQPGKPATAATLSNADQVKACSFTQADKWWQQPATSLPSSVANNPVTGDPQFCEFYQFAQEWFLYLISPSAQAGVANWQDRSQYPLLEISGNSCDSTTVKRALRIRTVKSLDDSGDVVLPERVDQAGAEAIYDQAGNVVFYEIHFSRNLCDYASIQAQSNFPGKTAELKLAWRVMQEDDDQDSFILSKATIDGQEYTLGLIGWHIVVSADNHPEMVWFTLDHKNNAIDCADIGKSATAYDFTSASCAADATKCQNLNQTQEFTTVSLPSGQRGNDVCQEYPYGTVEGDSIDTRNGLNIALIQKLNAAQEELFQQAGLPASLAVWENYEFTGALWISDIKQGSGSASGDATNQRGSLELANVVMETQFQGNAASGSSAVNCFACHNYTGTADSASKPNTAFSAHLSHIFDDVILGQCKDVASSILINDQAQAEATCPGVCAPNADFSKWNGQWTNQDKPMTVCGCCPDAVK
jgi:cytochrome c553